MKVKITRNTGIMGGAAPVTLIVNKNKAATLKNNEAYVVDDVQQERITVKAKQWFFGSKEVAIDRPKQYDIKINPICIILLFVGIITVILTGLIESQELKIILAGSGLGILVATLALSLKSWFILEER